MTPLPKQCSTPNVAVTSKHDLGRPSPQEIDPYVFEIVKDFISSEELKEHLQFTRSQYSEEAHYASLLKYDRPLTKRPESHDYQQAVEHTRQSFKLETPVTSISFDSLEKVPFISSSAAGYSYQGTKGAPGNLARAIKRAVATIRSCQNDMPTNWQKDYRYTPDIAYARTQLSQINESKVRHVWGKAFHNILIEGMSAFPLIEAYSTGTYPIATGIHMYHQLPTLIADMFSEFIPMSAYGLDIRGFDQTPQQWLLNDAFDILKDNIIFLTPTDEFCFEFTRHFFVHTPVKMPDGIIWIKHLGVPSGSYYTQLIDSIINHIVISYVQLRIWNRFFNTKVLGDDSLFSVPTILAVPISLLFFVATELGFIISVDKSQLTDNPSNTEFLGHLERVGRVLRPHHKSIRLSLFPEYPVHSAAESVTRVKGICLDTALNTWSMYRLTDTMIARYGKGTIAWSPEDANFITSVFRLQRPPTQTDLVHMWALT